MAKGRDLAINLVVRSKRAAKQLNSFETRTQRLGRALKVGLAAGAVAGGYALARFGGQAISAASDANEAMNKVQQVFGDASDKVTKFAQDSVTDLALSEGAALEAAGSFGNLFTSFGVGQDKAAGMSTELVQLAADLASFNNTSVDDAIRALSSGISGEMEALKRYGITLSDVRLRAEATAMGFDVAKGALDPLVKSQAAYSLIMKDSANAQGDLARTSDGLANTQKILGAAVDDAKETIGVGLVQALESVAAAAGGPEGAAEGIDYLATRTANWVEGTLSSTIPTLNATAADTRKYQEDLDELTAQWIEAGDGALGFWRRLQIVGNQTDSNISSAEINANVQDYVIKQQQRQTAAMRAMIDVMGNNVIAADHLTDSYEVLAGTAEDTKNQILDLFAAMSARDVRNMDSFGRALDKNSIYWSNAAEENKRYWESQKTSTAGTRGSTRAITENSTAVDKLNDSLATLNTKVAAAPAEVDAAIQAFDSFASSVNSSLGSDINLASAFTTEQAQADIKESGQVSAQTWIDGFRAQLGDAETAGQALDQLRGELTKPNGELLAGAEALFQQVLTVPTGLIPQVVTELIDSGLAPNLAGSLNHVFNGPVGDAWAQTFRGEGLTAATNMLEGLETEAENLKPDLKNLGKKIGKDIRQGIQDEINGIIKTISDLEGRVSGARNRGVQATAPGSGRSFTATNRAGRGADRVGEARALAQVLRDAEAALGARP